MMSANIVLVSLKAIPKSLRDRLRRPSDVHWTSLSRSIALMAALAVVSALASAQTPAVTEGVKCDPCVPAAVQKKMQTQPAAETLLPEAVASRLKERFDAADVNRSGVLTKAQAEAGGFGFIAQNFDAIDRRKTGAVTFEDVKGFLRTRGAKLE